MRVMEALRGSYFGMDYATRFVNAAFERESLQNLPNSNTQGGSGQSKVTGNNSQLPKYFFACLHYYKTKKYHQIQRDMTSYRKRWKNSSTPLQISGYRGIVVLDSR